MESILRAAGVYFALCLLFRLAGKRTLAQFTPFDAILLLIISETVQSALIGEDHSITNATIMVMTLVGIDVVLSYLKVYFKKADEILDGKPVVLMDSQGLRLDAMNAERVDVEDILSAARCHRGLTRLDEIEVAILEQNGQISIVPHRKT